MNDWVRVQAATVGELMMHFEMNDKAAELLGPSLTPAVAVAILVGAGHDYEAVRLLAHGLPKREAVWWVCLAARQLLVPQTDDWNLQALVAAEAWARKPAEHNRLRCRELARKTRYETPFSWAATAASWSTGSLAEPGEPEVAPPEYLYAHAVAGGIALAASLLDADLTATMHRFIRQGVDLAKGGNGLQPLLGQSEPLAGKESDNGTTRLTNY